MSSHKYVREITENILYTIFLYKMTVTGIASHMQKQYNISHLVVKYSDSLCTHSAIINLQSNTNSLLHPQTVYRKKTRR